MRNSSGVKDRGTGPEGRLANLVSAVRQVPIPTSPQPSDSYQEALGLNILSLAFRLEHIDRLSESLVLVDSTHMSRSVSVDINMRSLTPEQRVALRSDFGSLASDPGSVWLPIARQVRKGLAPVLVKNGEGNVLARATNRKAVEAMTHGLNRAFRMFLDSDPRGKDPATTLYQIRHHRHQSRWLIETAIARMVDGSIVDGNVVGGVRYGPEQMSCPGPKPHQESIRETAEQAVVELFTEDSPFVQLLHIASSEHILIVNVPIADPHVFIYYEAPVMPARSRGLRSRITPTSLSMLNNELTVEYQAIIPRAVNSYHVTVSVPEEIQIRRFFMTSDVDLPAVHSLVSDMNAVAKEYESIRSTSPPLLEQELQGIASRIAELGRRRARDLELFKSYVTECYRQFSHWRPPFRKSIRYRSPGEAVRRLPSTSRLVSHMARFAKGYEAGHYEKLSDGLLGPDDLTKLAQRLLKSDLDKDISVDNDPREHAGHAHWWRKPFGTDPQSTEPVNARVYIALVDDPPSLASSVLRLLFAVLTLVFGVALFLQPEQFGDTLALSGIANYLSESPVGSGPASTAPADPGVLGSADAIVTVLLLVPGLMLARLDIPSRKTVLGRLRLFPRYVAYLSVLVPSFLAVLVATLPEPFLKSPFLYSIYVLLCLAILMILDGASKWVKRYSRVPTRRPVPRWLPTEIRRIPHLRRRRPAVEFSAVEGGSRA